MWSRRVHLGLPGIDRTLDPGQRGGRPLRRADGHLERGTDSGNADADGDDICDGSGTGGGTCTAGPDNCPFIGNGTQTNSDALPAGDACQCGDLDGDGPVEIDDLTLAREHLMGKTVTADLTRCNVTGPSDGGATDCDVADIFVLQRVVAGQSATVENTCQAYTRP